MKIRNGDFTIINEFELALYEQRYESFIPEDQVPFYVCYSEENNYNLPGYYKHPFAPMYCKDVLFSNLTNAFRVRTHGEYLGILVNVFEYSPAPGWVTIQTENKEFACRNGFVDNGNNLFTKETELKELTKLWEVRSETSYNLPLPAGIEKYKEFSIKSVRGV
jgi:hypothetical protein